MKIPEIHPNEIDKENFKLIDVRSKEEFTGELGHIKNAQLYTLGEPLDQALDSYDKTVRIIFVCRSGNRSGQATLEAMEKGFKNVFNMKGGMLLWNDLDLEIVK